MATPTAERAAPGPRTLPPLGVLPEIVRHHGIILALVHFWQLYGDVVEAKIGLTPSLFFAHPTAIQHILIDNRDNYQRSRQAIDSTARLLGAGLLTSEGAHWRRQRHFMQGPFAVSAIPAYAPAIGAATRELAAAWELRVQTGATEIDMLEEVGALTLDILGRTIFGFDTRADAEDVGHTFTEILDYLQRHYYGLLPSLTWIPTADNRRVERNIRHLHEVLASMIAARRAAPDTYGFDADLLSIMLRARDEWGEGMLEHHLRDEVMTLYLAGHQTISESISWVFYALANNPDVERALHAELSEVCNDREPTESDIERLPYLRMVVDEALRLYPAAPLVTKNARHADVVTGYRVPAGALVILSPFVTHRHPAIWPDPERFDPLRHTPELVAARHRFAFLPFSAGYHSCIGGTFALLEIRFAVAILARRFRLHRVPGPSIEPTVTSTTTPKGLRMRLEARR
jgi:cytochrome P450